MLLNIFYSMRARANNMYLCSYFERKCCESKINYGIINIDKI